VQLIDSKAVELCRRRQPSARDIARLVEWAEANPAAEKVGPMLILFTQWWALQQYKVPQNVLLLAIARCAERGDQALWECIEGDFDGGRVDGAILVSLSMPDVVRRLPRLFECVRSGTGLRMQPQILRSAQHHGVPVPPDVATPPNPERLAVAIFEDRRPGRKTATN
jgi:hypothetical protein